MSNDFFASTQFSHPFCNTLWTLVPAGQNHVGHFVTFRHNDELAVSEYVNGVNIVIRYSKLSTSRAEQQKSEQQFKAAEVRLKKSGEDNTLLKQELARSREKVASLNSAVTAAEAARERAEKAQRSLHERLRAAQMDLLCAEDAKRGTEQQLRAHKRLGRKREAEMVETRAHVEEEKALWVAMKERNTAIERNADTLKLSANHLQRRVDRLEKTCFFWMSKTLRRDTEWKCILDQLCDNVIVFAHRLCEKMAEEDAVTQAALLVEQHGRFPTAPPDSPLVAMEGVMKSMTSAICSRISVRIQEGVGKYKADFSLANWSYVCGGENPHIFLDTCVSPTTTTTPRRGAHARFLRYFLALAVLDQSVRACAEGTDDSGGDDAHCSAAEAWATTMRIRDSTDGDLTKFLQDHQNDTVEARFLTLDGVVKTLAVCVPECNPSQAYIKSIVATKK